nr:hypothetical protein [Lachnospiraceae bacterium]
KIDKIAPMTYTGEPLYPETINVVLKDGSTLAFTHDGDGKYSNADSKELVIVVSNNVKKGTATVAVTGKDKKTKKKTFKITAYNISGGITDDGALQGTIAESAEWRAAGARPDIQLTFNGNDLIEGQDYTVKCKVKNGTGTCKITGKGNFTKNFTKTFSVTPLDLASCKFDGAEVYEGAKADKIKVTVLDPDNGVIPAKMYTVSTDASGKLSAGSDVTLKVVAKDANLTGETAEETFKVATNIGKASINAKKITKTYTGEPIELTDEDWVSISVKVKKAELVYGEDFEVVGYSKNVNKGNMIVTIKGTGTTTERGTFSGTKTFKVKILPKPMGSK